MAFIDLYCNSEFFTSTLGRCRMKSGMCSVCVKQRSRTSFRITSDQWLEYAITTGRSVRGRVVDHTTRHVIRLQCTSGHADILRDAEDFVGIANKFTPKGRCLNGTKPLGLLVADFQIAMNRVRFELVEVVHL